MDDQEQVTVFKPCAASVFALTVLAIAVALAVDAIGEELAGPSSLPRVLALVIVGLMPLGRALGLRTSYAVKVAPTWISGPGRKSRQLKIQREDVVALRRRDDLRIIDVADAEPIVIQLCYYGDAAYRLDSTIQEFASGADPWIVRRA